MDIILYNALIYTVDEKLPYASSIAILGNKIYKVGENEEILKLKTDKTLLIDCKQKMILPGFNDSHLHLFQTGQLLSWVDLVKSKSIDEVISRTKEYIKNNPNKFYIIGYGWNQDLFIDENRFITKDDLDKVSTDLPIMLYRACGHILVANSKAIELANLDEFKIINGGSYSIDSGIFKENAIDLVTKIIPPLTVEEIKEYILKAMKHFNKFGVTSVQSDDFSPISSIGYNNTMKAYLELEKEKKISVRIYEQSLLPNINILKDFIDDGYHTGWGSNLFKIGPLKLIADGSLGARTAALRNPYNDDPTTLGILTYSDDDLYNLIEYAHLNNMQIAIHGIGDKAIEQILNQYEKVLKKYPKHNHRHGVVHVQITDEELLNRFKELNIIAYVQPIFIDYDHTIVYDRVGEKLANTSYAFNTMINKGIKVSIGTDSPIESVNPFNNIYCAITRSSIEGLPINGYNINEKMSIENAIKYYTTESAYASFEENIKGKIKDNYLADLILIDRNIIKSRPLKLLNTQVLMTIMDGKIVYNKFTDFK